MRLAYALAFGLLLVQPALAQTAAQDAAQKAGQAAAKAAVDAVFTPAEKKAIGDYYRRLRGEDRDNSKHKDGQDASRRDQAAAEREAERRRERAQDDDRSNQKHSGKHGRDGLPPGLAKKEHLPPGLAKRETLPPGLAKQALPGDLEGKLAKPAADRERAVVGDDVVLIEKTTGVILDILKGVARK